MKNIQLMHLQSRIRLSYGTFRAWAPDLTLDSITFMDDIGKTDQGSGLTQRPLWALDNHLE